MYIEIIYFVLQVLVSFNEMDEEIKKQVEADRAADKAQQVQPEASATQQNKNVLTVHVGGKRVDIRK